MIRFACPECGKNFSVSDDLAGRTGRCKACGGRLEIPPQKPAPAEAGPGEVGAPALDLEKKLEAARRAELALSGLENMREPDQGLKLAGCGTVVAGLFGLGFGAALGSGVGKTVTWGLAGLLITTLSFWALRLFGIGRRGR